MTKIAPDDILEGFYKFRIRESEKLKTVLELYYLEIHQKKIGPVYHRLKTMVKRSIEHILRMKNFEARNGNYERNAVVKNQGTKSVDKEFLEIVGNGMPTEQCSKGDTCSFRHENPKSQRKESPVVESLDGPARITSKELAPIHSVKSGTLQNARSTRPRVVADLEKGALMHIARLMNSLAKGLKRMVTKVQ